MHGDQENGKTGDTEKHGMKGITRKILEMNMYNKTRRYSITYRIMQIKLSWRVHLGRQEKVAGDHEIC